MRGRLITSFALAAALATPGTAQVTQRVSLAPGGAEATGPSGGHRVSISADGRFVAFDSDASNLVAGDTNGACDVFVYDRIEGTIERVSINSLGYQADGASYNASISADGRYVAFDSVAPNLVVGDTNDFADVFVRDLAMGTTERVSVDTEGHQTIGDSWRPAFSADGRYVFFESFSTNLVPGDVNLSCDVFYRDLVGGVTGLASVSTSGAQGDGDSRNCAVSANGRVVAFQTLAANFDPDDEDGWDDVYVRDFDSGITDWISRTPDGAPALAVDPAISGDGRWVAFTSPTMYDLEDVNGVEDVLLYDRMNFTFERASMGPSRLLANGPSGSAAVSADGRYVAFVSAATNLVPDDTNGLPDVFVRDRFLGITERVSVDSAGAQCDGGSELPCLTGDARFLAFGSAATNLVPADANAAADVFVHDRAATSFTSLCDPGLNGANPCPCGNPPSGAGRGCDNSIGTGGAKLTASGVAYLSMDTLVFTTSGEKPTATSVLLQGTTQVSAGAPYGQGLRCTGGVLKRLYTKAASGGSITVPNFGAGDPPVSVRSEMRGNQINAGESRWYLVFYRDPVVLGGCNSNSTFNATQTGKVTWWP